jgi:hypothetical protein
LCAAFKDLLPDPVEDFSRVELGKAGHGHSRFTAGPSAGKRTLTSLTRRIGIKYRLDMETQTQRSSGIP